jgi:hypothetical protein
MLFIGIGVSEVDVSDCRGPESSGKLSFITEKVKEVE